jgi:hypothetical protein
VSGPDFEATASRLRAYLTEARPPLTIEELASALGCSPLAAGWAILHLREQGRLSVEPLAGQRFRLRSTEDGS